MVNILENISEDKNRVWENDLENQTQKFLFELDSHIIQELEEKKEKLQEKNVDEFPLLRDKILKLKNEVLLEGCGFFIISGSNLNSFNKEEKIFIHLIISQILGKLLIQNSKNELFVEIKDIGKSMKDGARYHHTREGGSYHTDGSHIYSNPPDYVGLVCINTAKNGGLSKFMSAYTIHNKLLEKKNLLNILYEPFHHDKRGENKEKESPTQFGPIFEYIDGKLNFKYQRELIVSGHEKVNSPLTDSQKEALDFLDSILQIENYVITFGLKKGDLMFSNNNWLIHDRTTFEDYEDENLKRFSLN